MSEKSPAELKALMESQGLKPDRHNWLYSFMNTPISVANSPSPMYLVAYCKQCDQTLSVLVPVSADGRVRLNKANVPKIGCDWGEDV